MELNGETTNGSAWFYPWTQVVPNLAGTESKQDQVIHRQCSDHYSDLPEKTRLRLPNSSIALLLAKSAGVAVLYSSFP